MAQSYEDLQAVGSGQRCGLAVGLGKDQPNG